MPTASDLRDTAVSKQITQGPQCSEIMGKGERATAHMRRMLRTANKTPTTTSNTHTHTHTLAPTTPNPTLLCTMAFPQSTLLVLHQSYSASEILHFFPPLYRLRAKSGTSVHPSNTYALAGRLPVGPKAQPRPLPLLREREIAKPS